MDEVTVARAGEAGGARVFLDGSRRWVLELPSLRIGRGVYQPGWRWSLHAGPQASGLSAAHLSYVVSGRMAIRDAGGREATAGPGEAFEVGPGHDAWVVGDDPCVALDFEPARRRLRPASPSPGTPAFERSWNVKAMPGAISQRSRDPAAALDI